MGIKESNEEGVMQQLLESVYFNQNGGRYCVSLPWRESVGMLADNFELCQCCRRSLLSRFRKDPLSFEEYNKVMKEQLASGVLERVSGDAPDVVCVITFLIIV